MYPILLILWLICTPFLSIASNTNDQLPPHNDQQINFIENKNQWSSIIKYRADIPSGVLFLEKNAFVYNFYSGTSFYNAIGKNHKNLNAKEEDTEKNTSDSPLSPINFHGLRAEFINSNPDVKLIASKPNSNYFNFFIGKDRSKWAEEVYSFNQIKYEKLYPHINLLLYSKSDYIKYDFEVLPGGNTADINIKYEGADKLFIDKGNLIIKTSVNEIYEQKPYAYQIIEGIEYKVECNFELQAKRLTFNFPNGYNKAYKLIIDPTLIFSSYSGSFANNFGYTATFDSKGFLYSGSSVFGVGYPTTMGAYQVNFNGGIVDMAISKYDTSGSTLIYSTYIGGSSDELPHSLIVDPKKDELLIFGTTSSLDFPTTVGAYDSTFNGGTPLNLLAGLGVNYPNGSDIIVARLSSNGNKLLGSTYVGGSGNDGQNSLNAGFYGTLYHPLRYNYADEVRGEIMIDSKANIYVATCTRSIDFPMEGNGFQANYGGGLMDGVIVKFDEQLKNLIWSSYLGGSEVDAAYGIVLDSKEDLYLTGGTRSVDFPVNQNVVYPNFGGGRADGFITHVSKSGDLILKSTYIASPTYDQSYLIQIDRDDHVFVVGQTQAPGSTFIKNANYNTPGAGQFIMKFKPSLDSIVWSTRFGTNIGVPNISPVAFLVDLCNKVYLTGWGGRMVNGFGGTRNMDITPDAFQKTTDNEDFYLMVMEDDASSLYYASFFGSPTSPEHVDGGTSRFDKTGKIYQSVCAGCWGDQNFPTTPGAVSNSNNHSCNNAVFKFDFGLPEIKADFDFPPPGCFPHTINFKNTSIGGKTFSWNFGDGTYSDVKNPSHTYLSGGIFNVSLIVSDTISCNYTDSITKQVYILGDTSYTYPEKYACGGNPVQIGLPDLNTDSLTFSWFPSAGLSDSTASSPFANPDSTTNYVLIISGYGCSDTLFQTVITIAQSLSVSADTAICKGNPILLSATGNGIYPNYTFSTFADFSNPIYQGSDSIISVTPSSSTNYFVLASNQFCSVWDTIKIKVIADSSYSLTPVYVCQFDSIKIGIPPLPGNSFTYNWFPSTGLSDSTISNPKASPLNTLEYTLVISNGICTDTLKQVVNVLTYKFTRLPDIGTCYNVPVQIGLDIDPDPSIWYWWTPSIYLTNSDIPDPFANPPSTRNYTLYLYNGVCYDYYQQRVVVYPQKVINSSSTTICKGDTVLISANSSNFYNTYTWSSTPNFLDTLNNSPRDSILIVSPSVSTTYYLIANSQSCNAIDSIRIDVLSDTVLYLPEYGICNGDTIRIGVNPYSNGANYSWNPASGLDNPFTSNPLASPNSSTFYTLVISNGSCADTVHQTLTIIEQELLVTGDSTLCNGTEITLIALSSGNFDQFIWSSNPNFSDTLNHLLSDSTYTFSASTDSKFYVKASKQLCFTIDSITLTIYPETIFTSGDSTICDGSTTEIWASTNGIYQFYQWSSSPFFTDTLNLSTTDSSYSFIASNNSIFYVKAKINECALIDSLEVFVIGKPLINSAVPEICENDSVLIGTSLNFPGQSISYFWEPFIGLSSPDSSVTFAKPSLSTNYHLIISNGACNDTLSYPVKMNLFSIFSSADTLACGADSLTIFTSSSQSPSNFLWSSTTNFSDTLNSNLTDSSILIFNSGNFYVQVNYRGCIKMDSLRASLSKIVISTDPITLCLSDSAFIKAINNLNDTLNYTWEPALDIIGNNLLDSVLISPVSSLSYYVTATNKFGCEAFDSLNVIVSKVEISTNPITLCLSDSVFIKAINNLTDTLNYAWEPALDIIGNNLLDSVLISSLNSLSYYVTATNKFGCEAFDSLKVTVSKVEISTDPITLCLSDSVFIKAITTLNDTLNYTWEPALDIIGNNLLDSVLISPLNSLSYYVTATNKFGCEAFDSLNVTVSKVEIYANPITLCLGDSVFIKAINNLNDTLNYTWEPALDIIGNNLLDSVLISPVSSLSYYVTATNKFGCEAFDSLNVIVSKVEISTDSLNLCYGDSIHLKINTQSSDPLTFLWEPSSQIIGSNLLDSAFIKPINSLYYYITASNQLGCIKRDSLKVNVFNVAISSNGVNLCLQDSVYLKANASSNDTLSYLWEPSNSIIGSNISDSILISPTYSLNYYVTATNIYGCKGKDTVEVMVSALPSVDFKVKAEPDTVYIGAHSVLSVNPSGNYSYQWTPANSLSNASNSITEASPLSTTTYFITTTDGICQRIDSVSVFVYELICGEPNIYIPNAFTPNNDFVNDKVYVRGKNIKELEFLIYNRWGEKIFETSDQNAGWDGTYKGMLSDPGVFVYYLTITCDDEQTYFVKGNITLIR